MTTIKARFDGSVFVPEEPVDLPLGNYKMDVEAESPNEPVAEKSEGEIRPAAGLVELLSKYPADPDWPHDGAEQHDHYLYGTPKR
ncbi:MAG: hypothetical protein ACE5KM_01095 [Planctomycetaceae bacterium]